MNHTPGKCLICGEVHCLAGCVPMQVCEAKRRGARAWRCKRCGATRGFKLLGNGLVQCGECDTLHFVPTGDLELLVIE